MAHAVTQSDLFENGFGSLAAFGRRNVAVEQREFYVIQYVQRIDQVEGLEDETERLVTEGGQLFVVHTDRIGSGDLDRTGCRGVQQSDDVQQGGLSATGGAHDAQKFTFLDIQVHILQGNCFDLLRTVDVLEVC